MLNKEQSAGLVKTLQFLIDSQESLFIISGAAGTGKTFLIERLYGNIELMGQRVTVATPTGKAASNLRDKNKRLNAGTIHSLMYYPKDMVEYKMINGKKTKFEFTVFVKRSAEEIRGMFDVIIIDEGSMLSFEMLEDMLGLGIPLIIFGDRNQLPAISKDKKYKDFSIMKYPPQVLLLEVQRTTMDSGIFKLAYDIIEYGELRYKDFGDEVEFLHKSEFNTTFLRNNVVDTILVFTNDQRKEMNAMFRAAMFNRYGDDLPVKGETVMCLKNGQQGGKEMTYNGQTFKLTEDSKFLDNGKISLALDCGVTVQVDKNKFFGDEDFYYKEPVQFCLGHAMTVHKSQGSEFKNVVFVPPNDWWLKKMDFGSEFLYTGVTRAKEKLYVVRG